MTARQHNHGPQPQYRDFITCKNVESRGWLLRRVVGYQRVGYHCGLSSMASGVWSREVKSICLWGLVYDLGPLLADVSSGNGRRICPSSHVLSLAMIYSLQSPINQEISILPHCCRLVFFFLHPHLYILLVTSSENLSVKMEDRYSLHLSAAHQHPRASSLPCHAFLHGITFLLH